MQSHAMVLVQLGCLHHPRLVSILEFSLAAPKLRLFFLPALSDLALTVHLVLGLLGFALLLIFFFIVFAGLVLLDLDI